MNEPGFHIMEGSKSVGFIPFPSFPEERNKSFMCLHHAIKVAKRTKIEVSLDEFSKHLIEKYVKS
jgi:hypothetical protein